MRTTQDPSSEKRAYILVATALSLPFLLGVGGLAIDIGRMYITKNEAQAYVDSASLAAARQLDGTSAGITRATTATGTAKWVSAVWTLPGLTLCLDETRDDAARNSEAAIPAERRPVHQ